MATTDNTRDKLLASMRKSKAGGARKKTAARATAATSKKAPVRRATAKPAVGNKAAALATALMPAVTWQASNDPYQSPGRIWPD